MANLVTFAKKLWKDATSGGTPITAAELNRMEGGINDCANQINKLGDSVSLEWWAKSITFQLKNTKTFAVVEMGIPDVETNAPFMIWLSSATPVYTKLPSGVEVANNDRNITVSCAREASFVVRLYTC